MLQKNLRKMLIFFSLKSLLMHSRWSRMVPNHFPDPRGCFSTLLDAQNKFPEIFEKSKFRPQNRFFHATQLYKREKRVFSITSGPNLSLSFQVFTKSFQGSKVYDQIKLSVERIFHINLIFEKNRFFASLIAKSLQKHAKIL